MAEQVNVKVLLFSRIRHILGQAELVLSLTPGATTEDLAAQVRKMLPEKEAKFPFRIAVNQEYVPLPVRLRDGDEVALIPPVQGG